MAAAAAAAGQVDLLVDSASWAAVDPGYGIPSKVRTAAIFSCRK